MKEVNVYDGKYLITYSETLVPNVVFSKSFKKMFGFTLNPKQNGGDYPEFDKDFENVINTIQHQIAWECGNYISNTFRLKNGYEILFQYWLGPYIRNEVNIQFTLVDNHSNEVITLTGYMSNLEDFIYQWMVVIPTILQGENNIYSSVVEPRMEEMLQEYANATHIELSA